MRHSLSKKQQKAIARARIQKLFSLAETAALEGRLDLANRYVALARKLSMRFLVGLSRVHKRRFCKYCYSYLLPGFNSRYRVGRKRVVIWCGQCNKFMRIPYIREIKRKRKRAVCKETATSCDK